MKIEQIIKKETLSEEIKNKPLLFKGEEFLYFDSGLTRHVFANKEKTKVIKILINKEGIYSEYNVEEYMAYENADPLCKLQMAQTELESEDFTTIIVQEFCNPIKFDKRSLTIAETLFATSCRNEVGWTADGRLVCYDLSEYKKY